MALGNVMAAFTHNQLAATAHKSYDAAALLNCTLAGQLLTPLAYNPGLKTEWLPAEELLQEVHQLAVAQLPWGASSLAVGPQSCPALPRAAAQRRPPAAACHCTLEAAQSLAPAHTPCRH